MWVLFGGVMAFNTINFVIAKLKKDMSIVDITWGLMFTIPNGILLWNRWNSKTVPMLLVMGLVTVWALRLSIHIGMRHKGEDWRYKYILNPKWEGLHWAIAIPYSYLFIFGMQGLFSMINNASAIYVMRYSPYEAKIGAFEIAGAIVWFIGQAMEIIGDKQL
jgi:steroid 5-alpha reductase family enzyme